MLKNQKFDRIRKRGNAYLVAGAITNTLGVITPLRKNEKISGVLTVAGCTFSIASIINYLESLERFDMSDDGEEHVLITEHFSKFVVPVIVDSLLLGWSLSTSERKRDILKKLNVSEDIASMLV